EIGDGLRLAEIDAAGELAQDDDIETVHHIALEARGLRERRIADCRTDVGEQAEFLAQPQQSGLRPRVVGHLVPFRPADRAEDDRVAGVRLGHGLLGDRDLVGVVAAAADQRLPGLEAPHAVRVHPGDELLHLGHHFRADAVAGEKEELVGRHVASLRQESRGVLSGETALGKAVGYALCRTMLSSGPSSGWLGCAMSRRQLALQTVTALAALAALAGGLVAEPALAQQRQPTEEVHCLKEESKSEDSIQVERRCLQRLTGLASRRGDALRLTLEDGSFKTFVDNKRACAEGDAEKCLL